MCESQTPNCDSTIDESPEMMTAHPDFCSEDGTREFDEMCACPDATIYGDCNHTPETAWHIG